jgi:hypothetical protein
MSSDDDLEELRRSTERGSRLDEPTDASESGLVDALVDALGSIDQGDRPKTIALRDQPIAALLSVLSERDEDMQVVGGELEQAIGRAPTEEYDRSEIVRLAIRVGLQEAVPEYLEELGEASGEHAKQNL